MFEEIQVAGELVAPHIDLLREPEVHRVDARQVYRARLQQRGLHLRLRQRWPVNVLNAAWLR
jgi:hypothetical protein